MKKLLAMVLAAVMVLSLCSCATAEETVALRVWVGDNADLPWINSVIENFKAAHPEKTYDISVDIQGEGDCSKRVLNDTEAAADVFTFADDQFNSLMNAEALQQVVVDADEIIAANGGADAGAVQASTGADGNLYAYPATADNGYFMFYNKEYLTEEDVQTLDGMLAKAAAAGKYVGFPMSDGWYLLLLPGRWSGHARHGGRRDQHLQLERDRHRNHGCAGYGSSAGHHLQPRFP